MPSVIQQGKTRSPKCTTSCGYYTEDPPEGGCQQYCTLFRDESLQRGGDWHPKHGVTGTVEVT